MGTRIITKNKLGHNHHLWFASHLKVQPENTTMFHCWCGEIVARVN